MMRFYFSSMLSMLVILGLSSCLVPDKSFPQLPDGIWRGVLKLDSRPATPNPKGEPLPDKLQLTFEEVTQGELPFTFAIRYNRSGKMVMELINGEERILSGDITFGRSRYLAKDTFSVNFPLSDTYIHGLYEENVMEGEWVIPYRDTYNRIPFVAKYGHNYRFTQLRKPPIMDMTGSWAVTFGLTEEEDPYPGVAELRQKGNSLTGTFLTETGDYRYLEGTVQANKLYLSVFDGAHAFLFEGKIGQDSLIRGIFRSGRQYQTIWEGKPDQKASLRDAMTITGIKKGVPVAFSFPDEKGNLVSLTDIPGKLKFIQIMGTWCPNCLDETRFLQEFLWNNKEKDIGVVGLAFERYPEKEKVLPLLAAWRKRLQVSYPLLWAGSHRKKEASVALPFLEEVFAFPTLLILNGRNEVLRVHTGFSGPATSQYKYFKKEFQEYVNKNYNK